MLTLEQVEKLREKANVSFEEAKAALDACGGDLLDALIYLEKQGKVIAPAGGGYYSSKDAGAEEKEKTEEAGKSREDHNENLSDTFKRFGRFCANVINKGNNNHFDAERKGNVVISCPVTVMVLLVIFLFWIIVPLLIIGLFFGFRYHFRGRELGKDSVNRVMDSATDKAEDIKKSFNEKNKLKL